MVEKAQGSDKASDAPKEAKPEQEAAKNEAAGSQKDAAESIKRDFRQRADLNESITAQMGGKAGEKFTISGLEGKGGKGAAVSEKQAGKEGTAGDKPASESGDGNLSKPAVDKRTDKELEAAEDVKNVTHNADGSRTINYDYGVSVTEKGELVTKIEGPALGDPPQREIRDFGYDKNGEMNYIKHPDGAEWTSTPPSDVWTNSQTKETWQGQVDVDAASGAVAWQEKSTGDLVVQFPDGSRTVEHNDGSRVVTDENDKVVAVVHPNGMTSEFKYDAQGNLTEVKLPSGQTYTTTDGTTWTDKETGATRKTTVTVGEDGTYTITKANGEVDVVTPAGSVEVKQGETNDTKHPSGVTEHRDGDGKTVGYRAPSGREFQTTSEDGSTEYEVKRGDSPWAIARDALKYQHKDDPNYKPTAKEVIAEIKRLQEANPEIFKRGVIHPGDKIIIPPPGKEPLPAESGRAGGDGSEKAGSEERGDKAKSPADKVPDADKRTDDKIKEDERVASVGRTDEHTRVIEYKDGTRVTQTDGRVTKVEGKPHGDPPQRDTIREYGYTDKGELKYIKHPDGAEWTRTPPSDEWSSTDKHENRLTWKGEVDVNRESGAVRWKDAETGEAVTEHSDGSAVHDNNGTAVTTRDGRVVKAEGPPQGDPPTRPTYEYGYDEKTGDVNSVKRPDGTVWTRTPPSDEWTMQPDDKHKGGDKWTGDVSVDPKTGAVAYSEVLFLGIHKPSVTEFPDGTRVTESFAERVTVKPDGTKITEKKDGDKVTETITEKGDSRVTVKADGTKITEPNGEKGPRITENKDGRVTKTEGPPEGTGKNERRETYEYAYNKEGELDYAKHPDGKEWRRTPPSDEWTSHERDQKGELVKRDGKLVEHKWKGEVSVNKETGGITYKNATTGEKVTDNPDGSRTERKSKDAPTISTDAGGRITRYEYPAPDNRVAEYKYDEKGDLTEAKRPNGQEWKKNDKGEFEIYENGKAVGKAANAEVNKDGSFSYDYADPAGRVAHATERVDGTSKAEFADGGRWEKDKHGNITEVQYSHKPDETKGPTRKFEYDENNNLIGYKDTDGTYWKPGPKKGEWSQYSDEKGEQPTGTKRTGVEIDRATGEFKYADDKGSKVIEAPDRSRVTIHRDKSSLVENADGTKIARDSDHRVTDITYPPKPGETEPESRHFEYDKNGNPTTITDRDGSVWNKDPKSDTWTQYKNKDGQLVATGETWTGKVAVDSKTGAYTYVKEGEKGQSTEQPDGTKVWLNHNDKGEPDGSGVLDKPDGSRVAFTKDHVTAVTDANGKTSQFKYDDKGNVIEVKKSGQNEADSTWTSKDGGKTFENPGEPGIKIKGPVRVDGKGNVHYSDGRGEITERTDGKKAIHPGTGGERIEDEKGRVLQMTDAKGETYKFEYASSDDTVPRKVVSPDGMKWQVTGPGKAEGEFEWEGQDPHTGEKKHWSGSIEVNKDGVSYSDGKTKVTEKTDGSTITKDTDPESPKYGQVLEVDIDGKVRETTKPVSADQTKADAEALAAEFAKAITAQAQGGNFDKKTIDQILKNASEAQRKEIDKYLYETTGKHLEDWITTTIPEGFERTQTLGYLERKDEEARDSDAMTIAKDLEEIAQGSSRDKATIEKEIRDLAAKRDAEGIKELEDEYRRSTGRDIWEDIENNPAISQETKDAIEIYKKGIDKRTDDDVTKLADLALKQKDLQFFQEVMRSASPEARKKFMDTGGEDKLKEAFAKPETDYSKYIPVPFEDLPSDFYLRDEQGKIVYDTDYPDYKVAMDYARDGEMHLATEIENNVTRGGDTETAIEKAFEKLSEEDRQKYQNGRALAEGKPIPYPPEGYDKLTEAEKKVKELEALTYYQRVRGALETASHDPAEIGKWEDMIATKGGSIMANLAKGAGSVYDDTTGAVLARVEGMTEEQWKQAKEEYEKDPAAYKARMKETLGYLDGYVFSRRESDKVIAAFEEKIKADSYEESKGVGRRSSEEMIADAEDRFGVTTDEKGVMSAVGNMTPYEKEQYRTNPEFRAEFDRKVLATVGDVSDYVAAKRILALVEKGIDPPDIIVTLNQHAMDVDADEQQVIKDIEKAFAESEAKGEKPPLRERIENPQTDEDRAIAEAFKASAAAAVGSEDYEYVDKAIKDQLTLEDRGELHTGIVNDDEVATYEDIAKASKEERDKLINDPEYREKAIGHLGEESRKIALYAAEQGEMRPEDYMRAYMEGAGTSEQEIKDMLKGMTEEQKEQMMREYARKYGASLTADVIDELGGRDQKEALRELAPEAKSVEESYAQAREDAYSSRDGVGSDFVDSIWDGTGYQVDETMHEFAREIEEAAKNRGEITVERAQELQEQVHEAVELFVESKAAVADAIVDVAMAVAGLVPGAQGVWVYMAVAGAAFKVATKAAIMGEDYDWSSSDVLVDAASGGTDAALNFVGGEQIAGILKLGKEAAETATKKAAAKIGTETLEQASKAGAKSGKEVLEAGTNDLVAGAVASASKEVDYKAAQTIAKEIVGEGSAEVDRVAKIIKESADDALQETGRKHVADLATKGGKTVEEVYKTKEVLEAAAKKAGKSVDEIFKDEKILKEVAEQLGKSVDELKDIHRIVSKPSIKDIAVDQATKYALTIAEGSLGGGASGAIMGAAAWDSNKSFEENMEMFFKSTFSAAAFGAVGGVAFTGAFDGAGLVGKHAVVPTIKKMAEVAGTAYKAIKERAGKKAGKEATEGVEDAAATAAAKAAGSDGTSGASADAADAPEAKGETPSAPEAPDTKKTIEVEVPREIWGPGKEIEKTPATLADQTSAPTSPPASDGTKRPKRGDTIEAAVPKEVKKSGEPTAPEAKTTPDAPASDTTVTPDAPASTPPKSPEIRQEDLPAGFKPIEGEPGKVVGPDGRRYDFIQDKPGGRFMMEPEAKAKPDAPAPEAKTAPDAPASDATVKADAPAPTPPKAPEIRTEDLPTGFKPVEGEPGKVVGPDGRRYDFIQDKPGGRFMIEPEVKAKPEAPAPTPPKAPEIRTEDLPSGFKPVEGEPGKVVGPDGRRYDFIQDKPGGRFMMEPEAKAKPDAPITEPDLVDTAKSFPEHQNAIPEGQHMFLKMDELLERGFSVEIGDGKTHYRAPDGTLYEPKEFGDNVFLTRVDEAGPKTPGGEKQPSAPDEPARSVGAPPDKPAEKGQTVPTPPPRPLGSSAEARGLQKVAGPQAGTTLTVPKSELDSKFKKTGRKNKKGQDIYEDADGTAFGLEDMGGSDVRLIPEFAEELPIEGISAYQSFAPDAGSVIDTTPSGRQVSPRTTTMDLDADDVVQKSLTADLDNMPAGFERLTVNGEERWIDKNGTVFYAKELVPELFPGQGNRHLLLEDLDLQSTKHPEADMMLDAPGASSGDIDPSVDELLTVMDIPPAERAEYLKHLREDPLFDSKALDRLTREVHDVVDKWDNKSQLSRAVDDAKTKLDEADARYRDLARKKLLDPDGKNENEVIDLLNRPDELRKRLMNDADMSRVLRDLDGARKAHSDAVTARNKVLREREGELAAAYNRFSTEYGVAAIQIKSISRDTLGPSAGGRYNYGVVELLDTDVLAADNLGWLNEVLGHEGKHGKQDYDRARLDIDDVENEAGFTLSPTDLDDVSKPRDYVMFQAMDDFETAHSAHLDQFEKEVEAGLYPKEMFTPDLRENIPVKPEDFDRIEAIKQRTQELDPIDDRPEYSKLSTELNQLENKIAKVRERYEELGGKQKITDGDLKALAEARQKRTKQEVARDEQLARDFAQQADGLKQIEEMLDDIRKRYKERTGHPLSDDRLRAILEARNGTKLTPQERLRAEHMDASWRESAPPDAGYDKAVEDLRVTESELKKLDAHGSRSLLKRLSEERKLVSQDPNAKRVLSERLFGFLDDQGIKNVEDLIDLYENSVWWKWRQRDTDAGETLRQILQQNRDNLRDYKTAVFKNYQSKFLEGDARIYDTLLAKHAKENGFFPAKGAAPRSTPARPQTVSAEKYDPSIPASPDLRGQPVEEYFNPATGREHKPPPPPSTKAPVSPQLPMGDEPTLPPPTPREPLGTPDIPDSDASAPAATTGAFPEAGEGAGLNAHAAGAMGTRADTGVLQAGSRDSSTLDAKRAAGGGAKGRAADTPRTAEIIGLDAKGRQIIDDPAAKQPGIAFVDINDFAEKFDTETIGGRTYYRRKEDGKLFNVPEQRVLPDGTVQSETPVISRRDNRKLVLEEAVRSAESMPPAKAAQVTAGDTPTPVRRPRPAAADDARTPAARPRPLEQLDAFMTPDTPSAADALAFDEPELLDVSRAAPEDILDAANLEGVEREVAVRDALSSPVAQGQFLEDFDAGFRDMSSQWDKSSSLVDVARESLGELNKRRDPVVRMLDLRAKKDPKAAELVRAWKEANGDKATLTSIREYFKDDKSLESFIEGYTKARDAHANAVKAVLETRKQQVQDVLDSLAGKHGLPKIKVTLISSGTPSTFHGFYGDGKLQLKPSHMLRTDAQPALFKDAILHEFVHSEQEFLVARLAIDDAIAAGTDTAAAAERKLSRLRELMDKSKRPDSLSNSEKTELSLLERKFADDIREIYAEKTGGRTLSDDHLKAILEAREKGGTDNPRTNPADRKLFDTERQRADRLAEGFKNPVRLDDQYREAMNSLGATTSSLNKLRQENDAYLVFHKLSGNPTEARSLSKRLFDSDTLPPEIHKVIDDWHAAGKTLVPDADARRVLIEALERRQAELGPVARPHYQAYLKSAHELEAHLIPRLATADAPSTLGRIDIAPDAVSDAFPASPDAGAAPTAAAASTAGAAPDAMFVPDSAFDLPERTLVDIEVPQGLDAPERTLVDIEIPQRQDAQPAANRVRFDSAGNISRVESAKGEVFQYTKYDDKGGLIEFIDSTGVKHENTGPGPTQWTHTTPDGSFFKTTGHSADPKLVGENYYVGRDGSLRVTKVRGDGKHTLEVSAAGGKLEVRPIPPGPSATVKGLDLQADKNALSVSIANKSDTPAELTKLMEQFEARAKREGLSDQRVAETYYHVNRLLTSDGNSPLTEPGRIAIARQILELAADPSGGHTIRVELRVIGKDPIVLRSNDPIETARLTADAAAWGDVFLKDPMKLSLTPGRSIEVGTLDSFRRDILDFATRDFGPAAGDLAKQIQQFEQKASSNGAQPAQLAELYARAQRLLDGRGEKLSPVDKLAIVEEVFAADLSKTGQLSHRGRSLDFNEHRASKVLPRSVQIERAKLTSAAKSAFDSNKEFAALRDSMEARKRRQLTDVEAVKIHADVKQRLATESARFDRAMKQFDVTSKARGLADAEVAEVHAQLARLLDRANDDMIPLPDRRRLATEFLEQAANPLTVFQGRNGTCNVTTIEHRLYNREPSEVARLLADVSTTGKYVTTNGVEVKMDLGTVRGGLIPDPQALPRKIKDQLDKDTKADWRIHSLGQRTYASQVFQMTAVNAHWQSRTVNELGQTVPQGSLRYEKGIPKDRADNGNRLMDRSTDPPRPVSSDAKPGDYNASPSLNAAAMNDIARKITGRSEEAYIIVNRRTANDGTAVLVGSADQLRYALEQAVANGKLPVVLQVHTGHKLFKRASQAADQAAGGGGWHVVVITDYKIVQRINGQGQAVDEELASMITNWAPDTNRTIGAGKGVTIKELYDATLAPPVATKAPTPAPTPTSEGPDHFYPVDDPTLATATARVETPSVRLDDSGRVDQIHADAETYGGFGDEETGAFRKVVDRVAGTDLRPGQEIVLGSGGAASVQIGSSEVDYYHAKVRVDDRGDVFVQDLDSVNGTYIKRADGTMDVIRPLKETKLEPGDRLYLGDVPIGVGSRDVPLDAPPVTPAQAAPARPADRLFYHQTTAPKKFVDVGDQSLSPGQELWLGRTQNNVPPITDSQVSSRHARARVGSDGTIYIQDLGSTNGTTIRNPDGTLKKTLGRSEEVRLEPGDRVFLSDYEVPLGTRLESSFTGRIGGRSIDLRSGEAPIGDGTWGVRPNDAKLILREDGMYLGVQSTAPIYLNGRRVPAGSDIQIGPRDSVALGQPSRVVNDRRQGEWLQLLPPETRDVPRPQQHGSVDDIDTPIGQSNYFAQHDEFDGSLQDGFQTGGRRHLFDENGDFTAEARQKFARHPRHARHAFVVDRQNDAVLRGVIEDAKGRLGDRDAAGRFRKLDRNDPDYAVKSVEILNELTDYVHRLFEPQGWSGSGQLDAWDDLFKRQRAGDRVFLGEYIQQGKGVCIQQSVAMKVLCDELGIDATLVRGAGLRAKPDSINHAWIEVRIPGQRGVFVYDPRNNYVKGKPAADQRMAYHKRGGEIQREERAAQLEVQAREQEARIRQQEAQAREADARAREARALEQQIEAEQQSWRQPKAPADLSIGGVLREVPEGQAIEIGRDMVTGSPEQVLAVSRQHADVFRQDGALWIHDKSSYGTYINGVKVTDEWASIGPGDQVTLGSPNGPVLQLFPAAPQAHPLIQAPDFDEDTLTHPAIQLSNRPRMDEEDQ